MGIVLESPQGNAELTAVWARDDRHSALIATMLWALVVLMTVPEGFDYESLASVGAPTAGSLISRLLWLVLLALSVLFICRRVGLGWVLARSLNPYLMLFIALAVASLAWSVDPALTARRLVRMVTIVLVCGAFVLTSWHSQRFQRVLRPILTALLVGSIAFGVLEPSLAIHQESAPELAGAWRGLTNHKNGLGALACVALLLWLHAGLTRQVGRLAALAGGALALTCLVLSRSSTSFAAAVVVAGLAVMILKAPHGLRPYTPYLVAGLGALLLLYSLAVLDLVPGLGALLAPVMALTGKTATLTGRTDIWAIIGEHIRSHPLLGTGYAAYWTAVPTPGADSYEFVNRMGSFYPGSAHNGYLDVANDLGMAGVLVLVGYIVSYLRQTLQLMHVDRDQAILYLALVLQQAITNLAESHWFSVRSVDFVMLTLATMALARGILENRFRLAFRGIGAAGDPAVPELAREREWTVTVAHTDARGVSP